MTTSDPQEELLEIADRLEEISQKATAAEIKEPLDRLEGAVDSLRKAWSGSYLGYHARIYYKDLQSPPPGAHFSPEWGMEDSSPIVATTGEWIEYDPGEIKKEIYTIAGKPDLGPAQKLAAHAENAFESSKLDVLSILTSSLSEHEDTFLASIREQVEHITIMSRTQLLHNWIPPGQLISRDSLAATQGIKAPPHLDILSEVISLKRVFDACSRLEQIARKAGSHLARQQRRSKRSGEIGTNIFIGHGGSPIWRELKDFIQDRLHLPWDEFNRIPVAGVTNIARLSEMLNAATIAFLIMTGEDEQSDGKFHARMNVIHEAGLFQGRLGFTRAIVLLEEGCEGFSNIEGLGQILFPKGNIRAVFDDVRRVLERENIIEEQ